MVVASFVPTYSDLCKKEKTICRSHVILNIYAYVLSMESHGSDVWFTPFAKSRWFGSKVRGEVRISGGVGARGCVLK